jgi:hypothetical protein
VLGIEASVQSSKNMPTAKIQGVVSTPNGSRLPISFNVDPTNPARFRTSLTPAAAGTYHIQAMLLIEGKAVAEGNAELEIEKAREESQDTGVDLSNLRRIAAATGGNWIDPGDPQTWPTPETESTGSVVQARTFDLWGSFTLLLLLLAVLASDWTVRVMKGFV